MSLQKINPALYIHDVDPWYVSAMSASSWYDTETATLEDPDQLPWMQLQGWYIDGTTENIDARGVRTYTYHLRRRIIKPEKALQTLINAQTSAFNEGRQLNDLRYDDLVTLYTVMLDKTETELNSIKSDDSTYDSLVDSIISSMDTDYSTFATAVDALMDDFGDSELNRINTRFAALLAEGKQGLLDRGMYNSTVYDTIASGIEREKQNAITELNDKINERELSVEDRKIKMRTEIRDRILAARDRLRLFLSRSDESHVALRNKVAEAMFSFMERREDTYPSIDSMAEVAASLGAGAVNHPGG